MTANSSTSAKVVHIAPNNKHTQSPAGGHPKIIPEHKKKPKPEKASPPKFMVLDTNVLIDDPDAINQFGDNLVVIPITVVRELDRNKGKLFSARHALKSLEISGANNEFKKLSGGGKIKIEVVVEKPDQLNDDVIIEVAKSYKEKGFGEVVFVTNDRAAAIKARAIGIVTENYRTNEVDIDLFQKESELEPLKILSPSDRKIIYENGYIKPYVPEYWKNLGVRENHSQEQAILKLFDPAITLLMLMGKAGTGKTMIAILPALKMVTEGLYEKVIITKPIIAVGSNDIGFLPGTLEDKMDPWIAPIRDQVDKFLRSQQAEKKPTKSSPKLIRGKTQKERTWEQANISVEESSVLTFQSLVNSGVIEIAPEAFVRGRSFEKSIVIIDEGQNFSTSSMKTWITRIGDGSKLIVTGDVTQIDAPYLSVNNNALSYAAVKTDGQVWADTVFLELGVRSIMSDWAANNL